MSAIINTSFLISSYVTEKVYILKTTIYALQLSIKVFYSIVASTGYDLPL